jgi:alkylation response protein AidB-like acyl-CoA dehydrogenase
VTEHNTYLRTPTADLAELRARFAPTFARIAEGNVERERQRIFPHEQVRWLNDEGFGTLRIPVEFGGFGASLEQVFLLLAELGAADANVAHIWRNHLAFVEDRLNAPVSAVNDTWIKRFLDGQFVGGGWTEANGLTQANMATTVTSEDDHYVVTGSKYYATGSLFADWLDVIGRGDDGELLTALVRRDSDGVTLIDDWTGFGQRTTASGSARYERVKVDRDDVFAATDRFGYQPHFYQNAILSVLTGITKAAFRDGNTTLAQRKRNFPQGLDPNPTADAQLLQVVGEISVDVFSAEAALTLSSRSLDHVVNGRLEGDAQGARQRLIDAWVAVSQAQLAIINAALHATTALFDALGASAVTEEKALDRHWRNARTLASHNPTVYKARILGDWFINGTDPVPSVVKTGHGGQGN